ncbi:hypothetical protein L210DRAFT_3431364, partial [Boletus edulis BED1]
MHVTYTALQTAVDKVGEFDPKVDDLPSRAKRLLQKCAYALISHQELSAQQVCSYLMEYGDHYTSHSYRNLCWTFYENFLETDLPNDEPVSDEKLDGFVDVDDAGNLQLWATMADDYRLRPYQLDMVSVWDFCAQIDKIRRTDTRGSNDSITSDDDDIDSCVDNFQQDEGLSSHVLHCETVSRPTYRFQTVHSEYRSHVVKVRHPRKRLVPVPVGPALPRRDHSSSDARYCRTMLLLFKPWHRAIDLRGDHPSWRAAFDSWCESLDERDPILYRINNIHLLHECKDARDSH